MATALDVITAAMKRLKILRSGGTPSASETADCLEALNDMLFEWRIGGPDLAAVTLESSDEIDVPDDHIQALKLNLAIRIANMFGASPTPFLITQAQNGYNALVAAHFTMQDLSDDNPLARCNLPTFD